MAEEIIWKGGRSPLSLLSYWVIGVLAIFTIILSPVGVMVMLFGLIRMYRKRYYITSERVKTEYGFFSRVTRDADLDKVQDTLVTQGFWGRLFNYGDLHFSTAGSTGYEIVFQSVSRPEEIKKIVRDLTKKPKNVV